jgi:preprotein translocase subunit Sss1
MQVLSICVDHTRWPTPLVKWYSHASVVYMCVSNQMAKPPWWNDTVMQVLSICVYQTRWSNPLSEMIRSYKCFLYVCIKPDGQTPLVKWYSHASVFCVYQTRWPNSLSEMIRSYKCFLYVCIKPNGQTPLVKWYGHTSVFYMCVSNQMAKPP